MMITYLCDQCKKTVEKPNERGQIIKKHYCDECTEKIDAFYKGRDELHDKVFKIWSDGLKELKDGLNLPD